MAIKEIVVCDICDQQCTDMLCFSMEVGLQYDPAGSREPVIDMFDLCPTCCVASIHSYVKNDMNRGLQISAILQRKLIK